MGRECRYGQDIQVVIEKLKDVSIPMPTAPAAADVVVWDMLMNKLLDEYMKSFDKYKENKAKMFW